MAAQAHEDNSVPAGWYRDAATGGQRWWDGTAWTEHRSPVPPAPEPHPMQTGFNWFRAGAACLVGMILIALFSPESVETLNLLFFPVVVGLLGMGFVTKWRTGWRPSPGMGTSLAVLGVLIAFLFILGSITNL